jgi:hypothetical protein
MQVKEALIASLKRNADDCENMERWATPELAPLLREAAAALAVQSSQAQRTMPSVNEYVADYEYRGDQDYVPSEGERAMIEDAIEGYFSLLPAPSPAALDPPEFAMIRDQFMTVAWEMQRPAVLFRPTIVPDGEKWCALYGPNLMEGVSGFGDTPEEAMANFDKNWHAEKTPKAYQLEQKRLEDADNGQFGVGA